MLLTHDRIVQLRSNLTQRGVEHLRAGPGLRHFFLFKHSLSQVPVDLHLVALHASTMSTQVLLVFPEIVAHNLLSLSCGARLKRANTSASVDQKPVMSAMGKKAHTAHHSVLSIRLPRLAMGEDDLLHKKPSLEKPPALIETRSGGHDSMSSLEDIRQDTASRFLLGAGAAGPDIKLPFPWHTSLSPR